MGEFFAALAMLRAIPRAWLPGILIAALLLLPAPAQARNGAGQPYPDAAAGAFADERALENTYQAILDTGAPNHAQCSLLLLHESRRALKRRDYSRATLLAEYARRISPDLPPAQLAAARARWSANKLRVHELAVGYAVTWWKKARHGEALFSMLAVGMGGVLGAFLGTLLLVSIISLCRYALLLYHDVRHAVPAAVPDAALGTGIVLLLCLPAVCGMSLFWLCIYWLVLLYGYHSASERRCLSGLFVASAAMIPLVVAVLACSLFVLQSEQLRVLWQAHYDYCDERCAERCEQFLAQRPDDAEMLFTLGLVHKKQQNYHTAATYFERFLVQAPGDYKALTNLGNVYLALQQWDQAVDKYRAAIAQAPSAAAGAHFNLARAFQQKFMFQEAEQEFMQAKQLGRTRIDRSLLLYSENYNRLLIDEVLSRPALVKRAYRQFAVQANAVAAMWRLYAGGVPAPFAPLAILCVWAATMYYSRRQTFRIARACTLCGKALCKRCQRIIAAEVLCTQCHNFLQKQEKMSHALRAKKTAQIMRHVQRMSATGTLLSWAVPGAGHIWKGKPIAGAATAFFFFVLLLVIGLRWTLEGPWDSNMDSRAETTVVLGAVALVYWSVAAVAARRVRSREVDDNVALKNIAPGV